LLRAEYLYLDFGRYNFASRNLLVNTFWSTDVRAQEHVARIGLNYKFDGGPVVAKY
jgi:opacity protein-like surface antigen